SGRNIASERAPVCRRFGRRLWPRVRRRARFFSDLPRGQASNGSAPDRARPWRRNASSKLPPGPDDGGAIQNDGAAARLDEGLRRKLAEEFPNKFAKGFVGRSIAGAVNVVLQLVEQLIG